MPAVNAKSEVREYSLNHIANQGFDKDFQVPVVEGLGYDGSDFLQRLDADNLSIKITKSGSDTYIAEAAPGTDYATAKWKAYKVDTNGNLTYADGNASYDNEATDLTILTYL